MWTWGCILTVLCFYLNQATEWNKLTAEQKQPYVDAAATDVERYKQARRSYRQRRAETCRGVQRGTEADRGGQRRAEACRGVQGGAEVCRGVQGRPECV